MLLHHSGQALCHTLSGLHRRFHIRYAAAELDRHQQRHRKAVRVGRLVFVERLKTHISRLASGIGRHEGAYKAVRAEVDERGGCGCGACRRVPVFQDVEVQAEAAARFEDGEGNQ